MIKYIKLTIREFIGLENDYESLLLNQEKNTSIIGKLRKFRS